MQPKSAERRCLFRVEVLQKITESVVKATNNGLKPVDEATAEDKTEETTPNAMG